MNDKGMCEHSPETGKDFTVMDLHFLFCSVLITLWQQSVIETLQTKNLPTTVEIQDPSLYIIEYNKMTLKKTKILYTRCTWIGFEAF